MVLDKTIALLSKFTPGSAVDDEREYYDTSEIDALSRLLAHLVYAPPSLRQRIEETSGVTITRSDFYSQTPTVSELKESAGESGISFNQPFADAQFLKSFLLDLTDAAKDFDPPLEAKLPDQFGWKSGGFSYSDAVAYYAMIRLTKPKTIIEMGCGTSTLIAKQALADNGRGRLICVEPFPSEMIKSLNGIELYQAKAQELNI